MSDKENFDNINDEIEDEDDEYNTLMKQELIALVKVNPALYAKDWKEYAGKNFCKDLAWESIGSNLSRRMSGKDAAKEWYNIRQRFGKERRKVMASLKRKSGQGSKPPYVSKWQFYNLCLFLVDHITPRKTASSYVSQKNIKKISPIEKASLSSIFILPSPSSSLPLGSTPSPLASFPQISSSQALSSQALSSQTLSSQVLFPQTLFPQTPSPQALSSQTSSPQTPSPQAPSPQAPSPQALSSQTPSPQALSSQTPSPQASVLLSPSSICSSDLESSNDTASVFSIENKEKETSLHVPITSTSSLVEESAISVPSTSKEMLKAMQKISTSTKRTVPEPDNFAKCKRKDDNLFMQAITKQSTALTSLATKLGMSLTNLGQCSSTLPSVSSVDPVSNAIVYALKSVPEEKRLECMVELLQIIKSKYTQQ